MSQVSNAAAITDAGPAGPIMCGFCKRPIDAAYYRALNRFCCQNCAGEVQQAIDRNSPSLESLIKAAGAGLLVGIGCAIGWAIIVIVTNFEIGIVATFIGVAVGKAIHAASGKRRGVAFQWVGAVVAIIAIILGKLMVIGVAVNKLLEAKGTTLPIDKIAHVVVYVALHSPEKIFSGFDLLWVALAVMAVWRLCKMPAISIAGPYAAPARQAGALQFDTVEPAAADVPAMSEDVPEQP